MTNQEIAILCAEAAQYTDLDIRTSDGYLWAKSNGTWRWYWPFTMRDQVMELILLFNIEVRKDCVVIEWNQDPNRPHIISHTVESFKDREDISTCVCMCVADMQYQKKMRDARN